MVLGPRARQLLPYINFAVATTALGFQTMVLYPWHAQLDAGFHILKREQAEILRGYHDAKLQRFAQLEARMKEVERRIQVRWQASFCCESWHLCLDCKALDRGGITESP
jgi:hypothetical protein